MAEKVRKITIRLPAHVPEPSERRPPRTWFDMELDKILALTGDQSEAMDALRQWALDAGATDER